MATVLLFSVAGLMLNLYTYYMLFGASFFALGTRYVLDRFAQRGTVARATVAMATVGIVLSGLAFWVTRIVT